MRSDQFGEYGHVVLPREYRPCESRIAAAFAVVDMSVFSDEVAAVDGPVGEEHESPVRLRIEQHGLFCVFGEKLRHLDKVVACRVVV